MGSGFSIRARRRTAAQQLALLEVKREISATDPHGRLKYIRDFSEAFRDYRREALRIYGGEQRWPAAAYWQKRHALT